MASGEPAAPGVTSAPSSRSVPDTISRLAATAEEHGLTIFARIDHTREARRVGLEMQEAQVLIFGNPRSGTPLMVAAPLVALELPLRVLVWADAEGRVWASYEHPRALGERFDVPPHLIVNIAGVAELVAAATT